MNMTITKAQHFIDDLPLAVRSTALVSILGVIFVIWYYGFWQNLQRSIAATSNRITVLKKEIPGLEAHLEDIKSGSSDVNAAVSNKSSEILSPSQTGKVLHDLLNIASNLTLISLENTPPKVVEMSAGGFKYFEHGVIIKFTGDYFSTMKYLRSISELKWKIFWDKFDYKVLQYPVAEVMLQVHTISNAEDWVDV